MKLNKKGMSLVECVIAMGVFAVATTGFVMAATACVRAQAKSHKRNLTTNVQTTNLEHFSNYKDVVDLREYNVKSMSGDTGVGSNMYQYTYDFGTTTITNSKVFGYRAEVQDSEDGVFELSFLSPVNQVDLGTGEFWFTLYNMSATDKPWKVTCPANLQFFDNEHNVVGQELPDDKIWAAEGGYKRFGLETVDGSEPSSAEIVIIVDGLNVNVSNCLNVNIEDPSDDRYGQIFFDGTNFLSYQQYNDTYGD